MRDDVRYYQFHEAINFYTGPVTGFKYAGFAAFWKGANSEESMLRQNHPRIPNTLILLKGYYDEIQQAIKDHPKA